MRNLVCIWLVCTIQVNDQLYGALRSVREITNWSIIGEPKTDH
mgnify:FL=1